jgi:hypothetical protein
MRYRIERIELGTALRWAAVLGLGAGLLPSLVLAGVIVLVARRLLTVFASLASFRLTIPAESLGPLTLQLPPLDVNLVERLGWSAAAARISGLAQHPWLLFIGVALGFALASALLALGMAAVGVLAYNRLAGRLGGLEVRLAGQEEDGAGGWNGV